MRSLFLIGLALLVFSCAGERIINKYYILKTEELSGDMESKEFNVSRLPYNVEIKDFTISAPYNQNRIALRTKSNEIEYYFYHQWADLPQTALTFFVWQTIRSAGLFRNIDKVIFETRPDYVISGTIYQVERVHMEDKSNAHLNMELELINTKNNEPIITHSFDRSLPLEENAPMNEFALKISRILQEETKTFIHKIHGNLTN